MDFAYTENQLAIAAGAREFALKRIAPQVREIERSGRFPFELVREMGEQGFFGCVFPEQYGGNESGFVALSITIEEITRVWHPIAMLFQVNGMSVPYTILNWGTDDQRERYVRDLITAKKIGSFGLTEPSGGSDVVGAMRTRARQVPGGWRLTGEKIFNSLASVADLDLVFARTDPSAGAKGITAFIVDLPAEGATITNLDHSIMGQAIPTCSVHFDDVFVPDENVLGDVGDGLRVALNALDYGRLTVPARCVGIAQGAIDVVKRYVREREAFGQEIGSFQGVQWQVADMVVETEAARWMNLYSAWLKDQGDAATAASAKAKYFAADTAARVAQRAFELLGGYAVTDDFPVGKMLTWANVYRTGEGSAHILRQLIAQHELGYKDANRHNIPQRFPLDLKHA